MPDALLGEKQIEELDNSLLDFVKDGPNSNIKQSNVSPILISGIFREEDIDF